MFLIKTVCFTAHLFRKLHDVEISNNDGTRRGFLFKIKVNYFIIITKTDSQIVIYGLLDQLISMVKLQNESSNFKISDYKMRRLFEEVRYSVSK